MAEIEIKSTLDSKYPSNSNKSKELKEKSTIEQPEKDMKADKKAKKVVKGLVKKKKKNALVEVKDELVEDSAPTVFSYIVHDVAIPAIKELIVDMISGGVEKLFFGTDSPRGRSRAGNRKDGSYVSYTSYYDKRSSRGSRDDRYKPSGKGRFHSEDYLLETRSEAADVLDQLVEMVDRYETVTIADFKDTIGVTSDYTDQNWGWTNLRSASIGAVRGGFVVRMPNPVSLI